jgi:hypothetical protein
MDSGTDLLRVKSRFHQLTQADQPLAEPIAWKLEEAWLDLVLKVIVST